MQHSIRSARDDDDAAIVALLNPIIAAGLYTVMNEPVTAAGQRDYLRRFPDQGVFTVAVNDADDRIVGMQSVERASSAPNALRHVGDISTFVALDAHRRGIGRTLTDATLDAARGRGFRKVMAMIRADNPAALAFYRSQGFTIVGTARRHAYVNGAHVDEVITERLIVDD